METSYIADISEVEKIYAVLLIKHEDNTGDAIFIRSPESISETIDNALIKYPSSRIRVLERTTHKGYFAEGLDRSW